MAIYDIKLQFTKVQEGPAFFVNSADRAAEYLKGAFDEYPEQESFWVVYLDRKNRPKGRQMVSLGSISSTIVHAREVFRGAILAGAAAIIVAHNHPSGDPAPSTADLTITRQLRDAAKIIGIDLLDHVVIGTPESDPNGKGFYSFREAGLV